MKQRLISAIRKGLSSALVGVALHYGRGRRGQWRLIELARRLRPRDPGFSRVCRNGLKWIVDPSFGDIDRAIFYLGCYELETTAVVKRYCKPGDSVFDVGANIGYFSILMAEQVGPGGRVFAFEPSRRFYDRLTKNVTVNGFTNVTIEQLALSDSRSIMQMCVSHSTSSAAMRYTGGWYELVPCTTLDDYVAEHGIRRIDFLKVDVDGWEVHFLTGAKGFLAHHRPRMVIEVSPRNPRAAGTTPDALLAAVEGFGYSLFNQEGSQLGTEQVMHLLNTPGVQLINLVCLASEGTNP